MDDRQRQYLVQVLVAKEQQIKGELEKCLQTCFELSEKPDLANHTKILVYLTICDLTNFWENAEKLDFAIDAANLVDQLKEDAVVQGDTFWIAEYERLEHVASAAYEQALLEESEVDMLERSRRRRSMSSEEREEMIEESKGTWYEMSTSYKEAVLHELQTKARSTAVAKESLSETNAIKEHANKNKAIEDKEAKEMDVETG